MISEWVKPIEIHRRMKVQYGVLPVNLASICWSGRFQNSIFQNQSAHQVVTPEFIAAIEPHTGKLSTDSE